MKYRIASMVARESIGASGSKTKDIMLTDPISALLFRMSTTYGTGARLKPAVDAITKLEVVDGSEVLMALSGSEMDTLHFLETGKLTLDYTDNRPSRTCYFNVRVLFGRRLWDPLLALDPKKFKNPQIKITYDATKVQAAATDMTWEVYAEVFDEKAITPTGFLRNQEMRSYTPVTAAYEDTELPTDLIIRKLMIQAQGYGNALATVIDTIKLSEDNDKKIPLDMDCHDLATLNGEWFGEISQYIGGVGDTTYPFFGAPGYSPRPTGLPVGTLEDVYIHYNEGCKLQLRATTVTTEVQGIWKGILPYMTLGVPFGDQEDINDWYDVTKLRSLVLRIKGGTAVPSGAAMNVVLQQLRKY